MTYRCDLGLPQLLHPILGSLNESIATAQTVFGVSVDRGFHVLHVLLLVDCCLVVLLAATQNLSTELDVLLLDLHEHGSLRRVRGCTVACESLARTILRRLCV